MKLLLLVLASATSAAAFGGVSSLCERAANGIADDFCEEWTKDYGCDSNWKDVCGSDHPSGAQYNLYTVAQGGVCWEQCSPEPLDYESMVYDASFKCSMDSTYQMESDSEGQLSGSCDDAVQLMLTWGVTDACINPNALPAVNSPAPPGWFQFVCCHYCAIGTNTEV
mmetsp:Transcript_27062/g.51270  ORF Transcript_27062/g.51270 Transcript_27062/m.51270 type:complete len:167 (-) Transcript_27062:153-653(-)